VGVSVGAAVSEAAECGGAVFCASLSLVPLQDARTNADSSARIIDKNLFIF
jgi:hypothetical protein